MSSFEGTMAKKTTQLLHFPILASRDRVASSTPLAWASRKRLEPHPGSKLLILGGWSSHLFWGESLYSNGYINPYYWVDDHPLLYGKQWEFRPWHNWISPVPTHLTGQSWCKCSFEKPLRVVCFWPGMPQTSTSGSKVWDTPKPRGKMAPILAEAVQTHLWSHTLQKPTYQPRKHLLNPEL